MSTDHTTDTIRGNGFGRVFLAALVWAGVVLLVLIVTAGAPGSAEGAGAAVGALVIPSLLAALAVWLITRNRARWGFVKLALLALPFFFLVRLLTVASI